MNKQVEVGAIVRVQSDAFDKAYGLLDTERRAFAACGFVGVITAQVEHKNDPGRNWRVDAGEEYVYLKADEFEVIG